MIEIRSPREVMRLSRLGSMHQCRLSFMRQLTRRMALENWKFENPKINLNEKGVGHYVQTVKSSGHTYSLVAFSHDLPDELRSDRVIATAWDATFTLFDGVPTSKDIKRLEQNVPLQEKGRVSEREIILSRANKSTRLWKYVVDSLSTGNQPDQKEIESVGYLMRTTAVYGSGKFGLVDREEIANRKEFRSPFQAEMLLIFLARAFVRNLVNHMAWLKGGNAAVKLDPDLAMKLAIGNSTGLGMAPFIVNHPLLFNNWILARETAIARVRSLQSANDHETEQFSTLLARNRKLVEEWDSTDPGQCTRIAILDNELAKVEEYVSTKEWTREMPWNRLYEFSKQFSEETQEFVLSLMLEPYPILVDELGEEMSNNAVNGNVIDGNVTVGTVKELIRRNFDWALELDWKKQENCARVWYVSEEKLEPRLGERFSESVAEYEQPLSPARDAVRTYSDLSRWRDDKPIACFLKDHPEHRHTVRRALISTDAPYSEIHDNTIGANMLPIDLLRVKLSFFGATQFDPKSDRWVRIRMYAGAPYPENITKENSDTWVYPEGKWTTH